MADDFEIRSLGPTEVAGSSLEGILATFAAALGYPIGHARVRAQGTATRRHATRDGFRAFAAFDHAARLIGFSYGYTSVAGLWWREQVWLALNDAQRAFWFADAFELCELHVHPAYQGVRLGSRLHDQLVAAVPHRTAVLSVMHQSTRARQLYTSRGWETLVPELRFSSEPATPFSILGLNIRRDLHSAEARV
jgi:ribosomal protein S18 acetylase RimI-like enzyme